MRFARRVFLVEHAIHDPEKQQTFCSYDLVMNREAAMAIAEAGKTVVEYAVVGPLVRKIVTETEEASWP